VPRLCYVRGWKMTGFLIDFTRFASRIGRGFPTGIDRVEIEYIKEVTRRDKNSLAVAKFGKEFVLVPAFAVCAAIDLVTSGAPLGRWGLRDFFRLRLPVAQRKARQFFRSRAIKHSHSALDLFSGNALQNIEYVNVGHSNLEDGFMAALKAAGCQQITVMLHDMIPLDFPQFSSAGTPQQFEGKAKAVARHADRVICNSADTQSRVAAHFDNWGVQPNTLVAHLGVTPMESAGRRNSDQRGQFVVLGTIEPRKNHQILFDAWAKMANKLTPEKTPKLLVIGRRGWNNDAVFRFLDSSPLMNKCIFEMSDLDDVEIAEIFGRSDGLLFPSLAEGFGLPALEAAQIGVPIICSNLAVFQEILGEYPTYIDATDTNGWMNGVRKLVENKTKAEKDTKDIVKMIAIPRWDSHFCHVFGDNG
jgi:glycosyltransferase involved in cell wall biosynthesis